MPSTLTQDQVNELMLQYQQMTLIQLQSIYAVVLQLANANEKINKEYLSELTAMAQDRTQNTILAELKEYYMAGKDGPSTNDQLLAIMNSLTPIMDALRTIMDGNSQLREILTK